MCKLSAALRVADSHRPHEAVITDIRGQKSLTLDSVGFEALLDGSAPTSLTPDDFNDDAKIEASYYPEVIDTLKKVTGGHRVFIFGACAASSLALMLQTTPSDGCLRLASRSPIRPARGSRCRRCTSTRRRRPLLLASDDISATTQRSC